jgi:hypothetical protein
MRCCESVERDNLLLTRVKFRSTRRSWQGFTFLRLPPFLKLDLERPAVSTTTIKDYVVHSLLKLTKAVSL